MPDEVFLRVHQVSEMTTLSQSEIYRRAKEGLFPKQVPLSRRAVVWKKSEVQQWMQNVNAG